MKITAVIITKNEAHIIGNTLQSIQGIVDEIIIVDSGSTDHTIAICKKYKAIVLQTTWDGYGINKNKGIDAAKNNWILNVDADEALDPVLRQTIRQLPLDNENVLFEIRFKNFFCGKWIRHGEWGADRHTRLFNRNKVRWDNAAVHELLRVPPKPVFILLKGNILHYTTHSLEEYNQKTRDYAILNAQKYFKQGQKWNPFKQYLSPLFSFMQNYIFKAGFLDGKEGLIIAKTTAYYTFLKYRHLKEMIKNNNK
jgi:glycosyltransferase involved in cell wall biosynthesis